LNTISNWSTLDDQITKEQLRKFEGFDQMSDSECDDAIDFLRTLSSIIYNATGKELKKIEDE